MERRLEENVSRWLEEELDQDDLIESEQEEDLREEENIINSPHETDTEQEDDENDEIAEQNNSDSDDSVPLADLATYKSRNETEWRKRPFPATRVTNSFNPKKAPGADGLTSDICQHAVDCNPEWFLALLNKCLTVGYFPGKWKQATVVVLRKPGKESYRVPKAYRPIGLLPVLGKIFEKMLVARLRFYLLPKISPNQYGFMPQRSTEDALYRTDYSVCISSVGTHRGKDGGPKKAQLRPTGFCPEDLQSISNRLPELCNAVGWDTPS
ncbi:uncharacterized protein LOC121729104 [Aricia agestis]|uniref:uncharacterized protein LOC121729104 n=1 Tax=Aricia agestis TaxID=91739 RepID=UPI001C20A77D|nr:uncharacterized protein LOC121729104 [Aricia agestis]